MCQCRMMSSKRTSGWSMRRNPLLGRHPERFGSSFHCFLILLSKNMSSVSMEMVPQAPLLGDGSAVRPRWLERIIGVALFGCALVSILTTVGIVVVLVAEA